MIGKTITIKGDVTGEESLIIEGEVDGTVLLKEHGLTIGPSGLVTASVNAGLVKIEGKVTGDITGTEKVVLTKTGQVMGDIVAPRVTLEDGAKFKGRIDMDPGASEESAVAKGPRPAAANVATLDSPEPMASSGTEPPR